MATNINELYKQFLEGEKQRADTSYGDYAQTAKGIIDNYLTKTGDIANKNIAFAQDKINAQIGTIPQQYQAAYDENAVRAALTQRQIQESMANMGLTDSGLNRTQQAAVQVARMNQDNALTQQQNVAVNSLKQALADYVFEMGQKQATSEIEAERDLASTLLSKKDELDRAAAERALNIATNQAGIDTEYELTDKRLAHDEKMTDRQLTHDREMTDKQLAQQKELTLRELEHNAEQNKIRLAQERDLKLRALKQEKELEMAKISASNRAAQAREYEAQMNAKAAQIEAEYKAKMQNEEKISKALNETADRLLENPAMSASEKLRTIYSYQTRVDAYGGVTETELKSLCKIAGVDYEMYKKFAFDLNAVKR